jgi:hypothetical protein
MVDLKGAAAAEVTWAARPSPSFARLLALHGTIAVANNAPGVSSDRTMTRWEALVRFDTEIREAAEKLLPFGAVWVEELGKAFLALNEDRKYLPNIVEQLIKEAEYQSAIKNRQRAIEWLETFSTTADGEATNEEALGVLVQAETKRLSPH